MYDFAQSVVVASSSAYLSLLYDCYTVFESSVYVRSSVVASASAFTSSAYYVSDSVVASALWSASDCASASVVEVVSA